MLLPALPVPPITICSDRRREGGLTLVELMVAITFLGVLVSLAAPSYIQMMEKRQLTQGAEQIFAFMNSTQGIASRSNDAVTVSYSRTDNNNWCIGATLGNAACDCAETSVNDADFCEINGRVMRLTNDHTGNSNILASITGDGAYSFDPVRGLMANPDDSPQMTLHSPGGDYQLRLILNNTGQASLCSTDDEHKVPGYNLCPVEQTEEETGEETGS